MSLWTGLAAAALLAGAGAPECPPAEDGWLAARLAADPRLSPRLADAPARRLQILVAELRRLPDGRRELVRRGYRVDADYFFPASAIKTFASVAALRQLAALPPGPGGLRPTRVTPLALCKVGAARCATTLDRSNRAGGRVTLAHEIRKTQLVSDNGAYNRLYDFVGYAAFGELLPRLGFPDVRVEHRLSTGEPPETHRTTPALELRGPGHTWTIPERTGEARAPLVRPDTAIGERHGKPPVPGPIDFAAHNAAPLCALQRLTIALVAPELTVADLGLAADDRDFLLTAMSEDPRASANPLVRDPKRGVDRFKPMLPGLARVLPRERIRYVNKAGKAYGFHVENAYVEDLETGRAFFLAATIYADSDGVIDDDAYDYASVTVPFYADLGELLARELLAGPVSAAP